MSVSSHYDALPRRMALRHKRSRSTGRTAVVLFVGILAVVLAGCGPDDAGGAANAPGEPSTLIGGRPTSEFHFERDRFPSVVDPGTVSAREAPWLEDADEVVGVVVKGQARAYAVTMMAYHHVVNDVIAGIPVLITY